ncbi:MAG: anti-sigma factor antagonist [Treponema sp.]|jgi:anti-sigma B factor antagonist|nr:anti-sigma factor antagonist [Treponema sp.]
MTINTEKLDKSTAALTLNGRLDTANAPLLEQKIKQWGTEVTELILDFAELEYISSMGLRVLLQAKKSFNTENRKLIIKNMNDSIREIFEMTGFLNLMLQEEKFVVIRKLEQDGIVLTLNGQMQAENTEMILRELSEIREQKTRRPPTDKSPEVAQAESTESVTVILDMEKLTHISSLAAKQLKQAIDDTAWKKRKLKLHNVSADIQAALRENGLREML